MSRLCITSDDLAIAVGVVTDPETTRLKAAGAMRAYLEIDGVEVAAMSGDERPAVATW